jgi:hypothetical protein
VSFLAAKCFHVSDGGGVRREEQRNRTGLRAAEGFREPQDRERAKETARIHLDVRHFFILSSRAKRGIS